jgi:phosphopantetheinyl transferase
VNSLFLSYSHTEGAGILIYSRSFELGVDLESTTREVRDSPLKIAERYFHETEVNLLRSLERKPDELRKHFLELWLKKEAYGKLTRKGLKDSIHAEVSRLTGVIFEETPVTPMGFRAYSARLIQPSDIRA